MSESDSMTELILMNADGGNIQRVGFYFGSPDWSLDRRYVAVGCTDQDTKETELCILDFDTLVNRKVEWWNRTQNPNRIDRLPLPDECRSIETEGTIQTSGILSVSWSKDGNKIAVVCQDPADPGLEIENKVCVLSLDGQSECWKRDVAKNIYRVSWSPSEDLIAISSRQDYESKIYLVQPDGSQPRFIAKGWSAEWSPDGTQLAFIRPDEMNNEGKYSRGIGLVDRDGTNPKWLYFPASLEEPILLTRTDVFETTRLTWSPDGKNIAFLAINMPPHNILQLFVLNIESGEIISLLDPGVFHSFWGEPAWEP
jgi:dipeptidyl aminopeptidase/acylaminoacyl peptidase